MQPWQAACACDSDNAAMALACPSCSRTAGQDALNHAALADRLALRFWHCGHGKH